MTAVHTQSRRRVALLCGITGQDGALLASYLLSQGYAVHGTSRGPNHGGFSNLVRLGIEDRVRVHNASLNDCGSISKILSATRPGEVYNLTGPSSVALSFEQPLETLDSIARGCVSLLEAIRVVTPYVRLYNAGSSECFGNTDQPAHESAPFRPRSPYAIAKAASVWQVANYREAYGLYACSGILFNHDSPLRPERFVTQKVVAAACRIAGGSDERLRLGDLSIERDWGWAPEYVRAMWAMLQQKEPRDYVIATGESHRLEEFVTESFAECDLDWRDHVASDNSLLRPTDIVRSRADPSRAEHDLGWRARFRMRDVVRMMVKARRSTRAPLTGPA